MQKQVNLDKQYLRDVVNIKFDSVIEEDGFLYFNYKNNQYIVLYVKDSFPLIGVLSEQIINYPHFISYDEMEYNGSKFAFLCLFIREEILEYKLTYHEKVDYIFSQFIRLMNLTVREQQKEIIKEFQYHWERKATRHFESSISPTQKYLNKINLFTRKGINERTIIAKKMSSAKKKNCTIENCMYIDLNDMHGLLPPSYKLWDTNYLNELFFSLSRNRFDIEVSEHLRKLKTKKKIVIILRIKQLNNYEIGMIIHFGNKNRDTFKNKICNYKSIEFISITNTTIEHSLIRNGQVPLEFNNVLIIGLGSLGSYVVNELPKLAIKKMTIVDNDRLSYDNLARHTLGEIFVGEEKVTALKKVLESNYKNIEIDTINIKVTAETIGEIIDESNNYDLIMVFTGNEDLQNEINSHILGLEKFIPTIFCWLEANSIGSHALVMKDSQSGCYNCVLDSSFSYTKSNNSYTKYNGCGGTYTEYGSNILLETTSMIIKILNDFNTMANNYLYSYKTQLENIEYDHVTDKYKEDKIGINKTEFIRREECCYCD